VGISLLVIACNEEARLAACVASARPQVDEVVVVVQRSSDRTLQVARRVADRVIEHPCHGTEEFSRADGIAACSHEWILKLDADEELADDARIRELVAKSFDFWMLRRLTTAGDAVLEDLPHGRLFRKHKATFRAALHHGFEPTGGATVAVATGIAIRHAKTWYEQRYDDERYDRMAQKFPQFTPLPPTFRPNTSDESVWHAVVNDNEYQLPDRMPDWCVIDCGGHIGAFAHACLTRGAARVISVEPDAGNFAAIERHTAQFGAKSICLHGAVWRSDADRDRDKMNFLGYGRSGDFSNTAGGSCEPSNRGTIRAIPLDVLFELCGGRFVELLKIDIEGAEGPVLHTSKRIGEARRVYGEWHEHLDTLFQTQSPVRGVTYTPDALRKRIEGAGFTVRWQPTGGGLGLFWAERA
jgi:FkbM family methyltransferase